MLTYWQVRVDYCFDKASSCTLYNFKTKKEAVEFYNNYKVGWYETVRQPEKQYIIFNNEIGTAKIVRYEIVTYKDEHLFGCKYGYQYCNAIDIMFPTSIMKNENKIADYCKNALKRYNEWSNDKICGTKYVYTLKLEGEEVFDFRTNKLIPKEDRYYDDGSKEWDLFIEDLERTLNEYFKDDDSQEDQEGGEK